MSVKLCLLHHLDAHERHGHVAELAALYHQSLQELRRLGPESTARYEVARLESELAWLDGLETCFPSRYAAE